MANSGMFTEGGSRSPGENLDTSRLKTNRMVVAGVVCAWCKQTRGPDGNWFQPAVDVMPSSGEFITHGICPRCSATMAAEASARD